MPSDVRPARPVRCRAEACEVGTMARDEYDMAGLNMRIWVCRVKSHLTDSQEGKTCLDVATIDDKLDTVDGHAGLVKFISITEK